MYMQGNQEEGWGELRLGGWQERIKDQRWTGDESCYPDILTGTQLLVWRGRECGGMLDRGGCSPHDPTLGVSLSLVGEGGGKAHEGTAGR